ncbi:Receptor-like kinase [Melia azedarach]|uniref:Receptor-like kinase n=1 Tax=Melia azedarach TaxID=155640 RepID=A0ACC1XGV4_MELAZ|nr:Receptor-like kinase [Melia azedarach]
MNNYILSKAMRFAAQRFRHNRGESTRVRQLTYSHHKAAIKTPSPDSTCFAIRTIRVSKPRNKPMFLFFFLFVFVLSNLSPSSSQNIFNFSSSDSPWRPNQSKFLLSPNSTFAAGFRLVPNSRNLYTFSIWYNISVNTIVWSANEKSPVSNGGSLSISSAGQLRLNDSSGENLWPSQDIATGNSSSTVLSLQDDGNLVYGRWESFRRPTDTILPTQKINGTVLVSKNGKFRFGNSTELFSVPSGSTYWNSDNVLQELDNTGKLTKANTGTVLSSDFGDATFRRLTLDDDGNLRIYSFDPRDSKWIIVWQALQELCSIPGLCGENSICTDDGFNSTSCVCPPGFKNNNSQDTACQRKIEITNTGKTKFLQLDYVKFSGGSNLTDLKAENFSICRAKCFANPKCVAFGFKYDGKRYCVLQDELKFGYWSPGTEMVTFLRVDNLETDQSNFTGMTNLLETICPVRISLPLPPEDSNTTTRNIAIICTLFAAELISGALFFRAFLKKYIKYRDMARTLGLELLPVGGPKRFTYAELRAATNGFSNLIGRGGFGEVYKGELPDHRVVAVKCLKNVAGGDTEFWPEVTIIARMHHLNLVRLWGFCAEKGVRILVYEYVPNGSLDKYLFRVGRVGSSGPGMELDPDREDSGGDGMPVLDWDIRYRIALGVARAIAYLHEECLEWVLHCDIKPENILLGDDFCPKISDFGLAKLRKKEDMVSMSRIRGTRGYMAPEWLKSDPISPKADVYSFGMVLLEIVSGSRNHDPRGSVLNSEEWYFPKWAFDKVFKEMKVEDILDGQIKNSYDSRAHFDMVNRMVQTAMWCLQDRPEMRPSMGKVAKMLEGTVEITEPKKPTIFFLGEE